jgi:DNA gyrase/topoisomerase IV subunit B
MYKTQDGLTIIEALEPIRRRPAMYIGEEEPGRSPSHRLLEGLVDAIASDTPPPQEIRIRLWNRCAITVAWDGVPLPIEPFAPRGGGVSHPALYQLFMYLAAGAPPFGRFFFGAILNALSERLVVSTMHDGHRYRVVFVKGLLATLLQPTSCRQPFGTTWFTFRPDTATIGGGPVTWADMQRIATSQGSSRICIMDHSGEEAEWF